MAPELVKAFVDEYCKEVNRLAGERNAATEASQHDLANTERRIEGILKAIEDGNYQPSLTERLTQLGRLYTAAKRQTELNLTHQIRYIFIGISLPCHPNTSTSK